MTCAPATATFAVRGEPVFAAMVMRTCPSPRPERGFGVAQEAGDAAVQAHAAWARTSTVKSPPSAPAESEPGDTPKRHGAASCAS